MVVSIRKGTDMIRSKKCFKCERELPITQFYKHPAMGDGHLGKCKECAKTDVTQNRNKNIDRIRAYDRDRARHPKRIKAAMAYQKIRRKQDARLDKCHNAVLRAIRSGKIERNPCVVCGSTKSLAHHESYNKPLDVVFYCQPHHVARHKQMAILGIDPYHDQDQ